MPVLVPTPDELAAMTKREREAWLAKLPARDVVRVVEVPVEVRVQVPKTVGVMVEKRKRGGYRRYTDADVVRCPLCGAWTLGVCRTGHTAPRSVAS